jgi:hypothetical protein
MPWNDEQLSLFGTEKTGNESNATGRRPSLSRLMDVDRGWGCGRGYLAVSACMGGEREREMYVWKALTAF